MPHRRRRFFFFGFSPFFPFFFSPFFGFGFGRRRRFRGDDWDDWY